MRFESSLLKFCTLCVLLFSLCFCKPSSKYLLSDGQGLKFDFTGDLELSKGSVQRLHLSLTDTTIFTEEENVLIKTSDNQIASVIPTYCKLSSLSPSCVITVYGLQTGTVSLLAIPDPPFLFGSSKDETKATSKVKTLAFTTSSKINVGLTVAYGTLGVDPGTFPNPEKRLIPLTETPEPVINYSILPGAEGAPSGQTIIRITGGLIKSSGILDKQALLLAEIQTKKQGSQAQQCFVSSQHERCTVDFSFGPTDDLPDEVTLSIVGEVTSRHQYAKKTLKLNPDKQTHLGTIRISTQDNLSQIPTQMNAPIFVNWHDVALPNAGSTITITLKSSNPTMQFYEYEIGNNIKPALFETTTCTLRYPSNLSCGLGIQGGPVGKKTTITAKETGRSNFRKITQSYQIPSLNLESVPQGSTLRQVTFTNLSTKEPIYVGITGGGANAYVGPNTLSVVPGATSANTKPGAGSQCGPSNPKAGCPIGSTCLQGGAKPSTKIVDNPYFCYYDLPIPQCESGTNCSDGGYTISPASGGTPAGKTTIAISRSSGLGDSTNIVWSGNFFARTNCDTKTGICENAGCAGQEQGLICGPGTGGSPGVNTLAELTFQRQEANDFYDVSIINGINFGVSFGPTNVSADPSNAYTCGTAGSRTAQDGGWSSTNKTAAGLPPSLWTGSVPQASTPAKDSSFPPGHSITQALAPAHYRYVSVVDSSKPTTCSSGTCTPGSVCGYWIATAYNKLSSSGTRVINSKNSAYTQYCGKPIAWITADSIYGLNKSGKNIGTLPFDYTLSTGTNTIPPGPSHPHTVGDQQLCIDDAYSSYNARPGGIFGENFLACGAPKWDDLNITRVKQQPNTIGTEWFKYVQPTLIWLKKLCPTCYTYPFDDESSTFVCNKPGEQIDYDVNFYDTAFQ